MPNDDEQSWLSNPWVLGSLALASGIGAAAHPAIARGLHGAVGIGRAGLGLHEWQQERLKRKRLGERLGKLASATVPTTETRVGFDPNATIFKEVDQNARLSEIMGGSALAPPGELPTHEVTSERPLFHPRQQEYLKAVAETDPEAAVKNIGSTLFREPAAQNIFGSAETGYYSLDREGRVRPLVGGTPKPSPRPSVSAVGGEKVHTRWNPVAKDWEVVREPLTPAPMSPERVVDMEERRQLQAESIEARREAAKQAAEDRRQAARAAAEFRRESLADRQAARAERGDMLSVIERERAMRPEDLAIVESEIVRTALARGVDKMPRRAQLVALRKIAEDYGFTIEGEPTLERSSAFGLMGEDALRGDFSLRPKPLKSTTQRSTRPTAGAKENDPLGIR